MKIVFTIDVGPPTIELFGESPGEWLARHGLRAPTENELLAGICEAVPTGTPERTADAAVA